MTRRSHILLGLLGTSVVFGLACGEASLNVTKPTPTPDPVDCSFRGGVQEVFASRDCANVGCHFDPGIGQLTLASDTMSNGDIHELLLDSGGTTQRSSNCANESPECADDPANPPAGGFCCTRAVRPGHPEFSLLLQKPFLGNPITHGGGKQLGSDQDPSYLSIKCWIEDGAPDN